MNPIGFIRTPFKFKNGTPRQPTVCSHAGGSLTIEKSVFNNPEHSLEGLEEFSHIWILFVFHKNNNDCTKAKVKPPRLNGKKVGLFSTRCPYRPNNIGLTLAKLESVRGATVNVSGIDILDGTPVLDIKPYIPQYDCPTLGSSTDEVVDNGEPKQVHADEFGDKGEKADDITKYTTEDGHSEHNSNDQTTCSEAKHDSNEMAVRPEDDNYAKGHIEQLADVNCIRYLDTPEKDNPSDEQTAGLESSCQTARDKVDSIESSIVNSRSVEKQDGSMKCTLDINDVRVQHKLEDKEQNSSDESFRHQHDDNGLQTVNVECTEDLGNKRPANLPVGPDRETEKCSRDKLSCERTPSEKFSHTAKWIIKPNVERLHVRFTSTADEQLRLFSEVSHNKVYSLQFLKRSEVKKAVISILQEDPRSTYRRKNCIDNLYYFTVDSLHVTCWFEDNMAEVVRVKPAALVEQCKSEYT